MTGVKESNSDHLKDKSPISKCKNPVFNSFNWNPSFECLTTFLDAIASKRVMSIREVKIRKLINGRGQKLMQSLWSNKCLLTLFRIYKKKLLAPQVSLEFKPFYNLLVLPQYNQHFFFQLLTWCNYDQICNTIWFTVVIFQRNLLDVVQKC